MNQFLPMEQFPNFRFWCQKVLPLVYDESLSYYEVLCKVVDHLNALTDNSNNMVDNIDTLKAELAAVQEWINHFDPGIVSDIMAEYLAQMVYFQLNDAGYFTAVIPASWHSIQFNTTGLDITTQICPEYGHLVLSY